MVTRTRHLVMPSCLIHDELILIQTSFVHAAKHSNYLLNEPKAGMSPEGIDRFFRHVFSQGITADETNLDLSDLKCNPSKLREPEVLLQKKLSVCISSLSPGEFIVHNFVRSYTAMSLKTSFLLGRSARRRLSSIVTVVWIQRLYHERYLFPWVSHMTRPTHLTHDSTIG
jgi:hypothetical protein